MTNGTLTVTGAVLSVTANNATRPYGAANPVFSGTITGIQNGDNITATYATTATMTSPVGTYPIVPTLVDPSNKLPNYAVTTNNGILTITAVPAPTILSIVGSPGNTNVTITWTSISNSVYRVQYKTSLSSTSWLNLAPGCDRHRQHSFIHRPSRHRIPTLLPRRDTVRRFLVHNTYNIYS